MRCFVIVLVECVYCQCSPPFNPRAGPICNQPFCIVANNREQKELRRQQQETERNAEKQKEMAASSHNKKIIHPAVIPDEAAAHPRPSTSSPARAVSMPTTASVGSGPSVSGPQQQSVASKATLGASTASKATIGASSASNATLGASAASKATLGGASSKASYPKTNAKPTPRTERRAKCIRKATPVDKKKNKKRVYPVQTIQADVASPEEVG